MADDTFEVGLPMADDDRRDENEFAVGSARPGHYGAETGGVTLSETKFAAAWNIQGDAGRRPFADPLLWMFNFELPTVPNTTLRSGERTVFWLAPMSWLLVSSSTAALQDFESRRDSLNAVGGALFDVSASRIAWTVAGAHAADVLAKSCPLDFHLRGFAEDACAQSMLGHVNALFYRRAPSAFTVLVARSFARDVWRALCVSAAPYGYDVLAPRAF